MCAFGCMCGLVPIACGHFSLIAPVVRRLGNELCGVTEREREGGRRRETEIETERQRESQSGQRGARWKLAFFFM